MRDDYDDEFYEAQHRGSLESARKILGMLFAIYEPKSVVDFGCGVGSWLAVAEELGAVQLTGFEGSWVGGADLLSSSIALRPIDFETAAPSVARHDLCISVEVAEHVDASRADSFVAMLCGAADTVVFGAAIPGQGGQNHINEQPQSYWKARFESHGMQCFDLFRPALWNDPSVDFWYRQNTFLYTRDEPLAHELAQRPWPGVIDAVHPELLAKRIAQKKKPEPPTVDPPRRAAFASRLGSALRQWLGGGG